MKIFGIRSHSNNMFIGLVVVMTVTRRVKGYSRFVEKYVLGRRKRFLPYKEYIYY